MSNPPPPTPAAPTAAFSWRTDDTDPLTVCFESSSFGPDGSPADTLGHQWSFGNDTGKTACHRFPECGTYPVTLAVTTNAGITATVTQNVTTTCAGGTNRPTARISADHVVVDCSPDTTWTFTPHALTADADGTPWESSTQLQFRWEMNGQTHDGDTFVTSAPSNQGVSPTLTVTDTRFGTTAVVGEFFSPEGPPPEPVVTGTVLPGTTTIRISYFPAAGRMFSEIEVYTTAGVPVTDAGATILKPPAVRWTATPPNIALTDSLDFDVTTEELMSQHSITDPPERWTLQLRYKGLKGTCGATFDDPEAGISRTTPSAATPIGRIVEHPTTATEGPPASFGAKFTCTYDAGAGLMRVRDTTYEDMDEEARAWFLAKDPNGWSGYGPTGYTWDWGDGSEPFGTPSGLVSNKYDAPGSYLITMTIRLQNGETIQATQESCTVPPDPPVWPDGCISGISANAEPEGAMIVQTVVDGHQTNHVVVVPIAADYGVDAATLAAMNPPLTVRVSITYLDGFGEEVRPLAIWIPATETFSVRAYSSAHTSNRPDTTGMIIARLLHEANEFDMKLEAYIEGQKCTETTITGIPVPENVVNIGGTPPPCPDTFEITKLDPPGSGLPTMIQRLETDGFEYYKMFVPFNFNTAPLTDADLAAKNLNLSMWIEYTDSLGTPRTTASAQLPAGVEGGGAQNGQTGVEIAAQGYTDETRMIQAQGMHQGGPKPFKINFSLYNRDTFQICQPVRSLEFETYLVFAEGEYGEGGSAAGPTETCPDSFLVSRSTTSPDLNNENTGTPILTRIITAEGIETTSISVPITINYGSVPPEDVRSMGLRLAVEARGLDKYADLGPSLIETWAGDTNGWAGGGPTTVEIATVGFNESPNHVRLDGMSDSIPWGVSVEDLPAEKILSDPNDATRARTLARPFELTFRLYNPRDGTPCGEAQTITYEGFHGFLQDDRPDGTVQVVSPEEFVPPECPATPESFTAAKKAIPPQGGTYTLKSDNHTDTHWYEVPVAVDYGMTAADLAAANLELRATLLTDDEAAPTEVGQISTKAGASWAEPDADGTITIHISSRNPQNIPGDASRFLHWEGLHSSGDGFRLSLQLLSAGRGGLPCPDTERRLSFGPHEGNVDVAIRDTPPPSGEDAGVEDDGAPTPTFSITVDEEGGTITLTDTTSDARLSGHIETEWTILAGSSDVVVVEGALSDSNTVTFQIPDDVPDDVLAVQLTKRDPSNGNTARGYAAVPTKTKTPPGTSQERGYPTTDFLLYPASDGNGFDALNLSWGPDTDTNLAFEWSLPANSDGGATSSTETNVYNWTTQPGTHEVTLTATDPDTGRSTTTTKTITVVAPGPPPPTPKTIHADFEYELSDGNTGQVQLKSTSTSQGEAIDTFEWTIDEGDITTGVGGIDPETGEETLEGETATFTADTPGPVRVTLTVGITSTGETDTVSKRILLGDDIPLGPTADFEWDKREQVDPVTDERDYRTIVFTNKSKAPVVNRYSTRLVYYWSFGDGTFSTQKNPVHQYPLKNTDYRVDLIVVAVPVADLVLGDIEPDLSLGVRGFELIDQTTHVVNTDGRLNSVEHVVDFEYDNDYPLETDGAGGFAYSVLFYDKSTNDPRILAQYPDLKKWSWLDRWAYDFGDGSEARVFERLDLPRNPDTPPFWQSNGFFHEFPVDDDPDRRWGPTKFQVTATVRNFEGESKSRTKEVVVNDYRPRPDSQALIGKNPDGTPTYVIIPLDKTKVSPFHDGATRITHVRYDHPGGTTPTGPMGTTTLPQPAFETLTITYPSPGPKEITTTYIDDTGLTIRQTETLVIPS